MGRLRNQWTGRWRERERESFITSAVRLWAHRDWCRGATLWDPGVLGGDHSTRGLASCDRSALFGVDLRRWILSRHDSWAIGDHSEPVKAAFCIDSLHAWRIATLERATHRLLLRISQSEHAKFNNAYGVRVCGHWVIRKSTMVREYQNEQWEEQRTIALTRLVSE